MNLQEFRQQYPQYDDLSDEALTKGLHKKFYSDMPFDQFASKIGFTAKQPEPAAPTAAPIIPGRAPKPEEDTTPLLERVLGQTVGKPADALIGGAVDLPLQVASGLAGGVEMVANFFGANNKVGNAMRDTQGYLSGLLSASAKNDKEEIARILKDAEDKGTLDQVMAGLKAFTVAPVDMMAQAFGTMAPTVIAGAATVLAGAPALLATGIGLGVGAVMGAGAVKGSIYQATEEILKERTDLSDKEIEHIAEQAQAYNGKNLDSILIGSGLGMVGARTGAETIFAKNLAKGITSKAATLDAINAATKAETEKMAKEGVKKTALKKGAAEFLGEGAEGGQEQMAGNIAQQREGFTDVPTMRGVVSQGTMEGMAGLGLGAYGGGREAYKAQRELAAPATDKEKDFLAPDDVQKRQAAANAPQTLPPDLQAELTSSTVAPGGSAAPPAAPPAPPPPATTTPAAPAAPAGPAAEDITKAETYVSEVDSGAKKLNPSTLKSLSIKLGIDLPNGTSNTDRFNAVKTKLAEIQGAGNVAGTQQPAAGTGAGMAGKPPAGGTSTGTGNTQQGGVDTAGGVAVTTAGGEGQQQSTLTEAQIRALTDDQLENLEIEHVMGFGEEAERKLVKAELDRRKAGAPAGTKGATPANAAKLENLSQRRNEMLDLIDEGLPANHNKVKNKLKALNNLETELGLELSTYDNVSFSTEPKGGGPVLSAKKQKYVSIADVKARLEAEGKDVPDNLRVVAADSHPAFQIDPEASAEENLRGAMELAAQREKAEEEERQRLVKESEKKGEGRYTELTEEDKAGYEAMREQNNRLPAWNKLEADEKDVYYGNIVYGNAAEHRRAAAELIKYLDQKGSREAGYKKSQELEGPPTQEQKTKLDVADKAATPAGRRTILNYEANREIASKMFGVTFPRWGDLSIGAQKAYLDALVNNAGLQQDVAFAKAGEQMLKERGDIDATQKAQELKNLEARQKEVRAAAERNKAELDRINKAYERAVEGFTTLGSDSLSKTATDHLAKGHLQQALEDIADRLRKNPDKRKQMAGQIAARLASLGLKTKVRISTERLPNGDLAQYDPYTDTILIGPEGFTNSTVLHEVTHAGTVRVLYLYLSGKKNLLTERQIKGAEQIIKIMLATKKALAADFPNAYELDENGENPNVYEFIAYALNDKAFQAALHEFSIGYGEGIAADRALKDAGFEPMFGTQPIESLLPAKKSAWSAFKRAIAGIVNFAQTPFNNIDFLMELNAAFDDILSVPTEPINLDSLAARKKKGAPGTPKQQAPQYQAPGFLQADPRYTLTDKELPPSRWSRLKKALFTTQGWRETAKNIQDRRAYAKDAQRKASLARRVIRDLSSNFNNFYDQLVASAAEAENFYNGRLQVPMDNLRSAVQEFSTAMGKSTKEIMEMLHPMMEAFHEPERRFAKWMMTVPLSKDPVLMHNGKPISPADRREQILGNKEKGIKGIIHKVALTDQQKADLRKELEFLTGGKLVKGPEGMFTFQKSGGFTDPKAGYSPRTDAKIKTDDFYDKGGIYNVLGIGEEQVEKVRQELATLTPEQRAAFDKIIANASEVSKQSAKLDQIGRYWSFPVSNITGIYDYQYYMPFKGKGKGDTKHSDVDESIDPNSKRNGREMQEIPFSMDGRFSASTNPLLQLMSDATRAAGRAGRRNVTQAIKNALPADPKKNPNGTGIINGEVKKTILFEDRETEDLSQYKNENYIFHYNDDGSMDILFVQDPKLRNSIRLSFQKTNFALDAANRITGFFGRMHTRYNFDFPMLNFVRDILTNAWTIGAEMGPTKSLKFIKEVATQVTAHNGLYKALKVAALHESGNAADIRELQRMEKNDPYVQDMLEYLRRGGKTTYLSGFALRSQLEQLDKGLGKGRIMTKAEDIGKLLDIWVNMFEFASRTAAFSLTRDEFEKRNIAEGMNPAQAREAAIVEAATYTKELANFEQVGEYGRGLGALYMFIRPSATGAVRAIEAVAPAFRDIPGAKWAFGTAQNVADTLPEGIRNDPKALEAFMKNYKAQQKSARAMASILIGAGAAMFLLSAAGAADDDEGRNATLNDNMEQWTRFARFHLPNSVSEPLGLGRDVVYQMPWGFGLGSFMSMGAQLAAMGVGTTSMKEGMSNMVSALLDSFVPIPFSKMPVSEMPGHWFIDSITPTVFRPAVEFLMNKNGIGQDINSAATRRIADAFTGGDRVPELYRDLSETIFEGSDGETDVTPNTLYFFANSYLDGIARIAQLMYNSGTKDERDFSPRLDLPMFSSFFGAKSNVDAREFGKMENKVKEIDKKLATFDKDIVKPEVAAAYESKYPMYRDIVEIYKDHKKQLDVLRKEANDIRTEGLLIRDRQDRLRENIIMQNVIKREMIEQVKAYDPDF